MSIFELTLGEIMDEGKGYEAMILLSDALQQEHEILGRALGEADACLRAINVINRDSIKDPIIDSLSK